MHSCFASHSTFGINKINVKITLKHAYVYNILPDPNNIIYYILLKIGFFKALKLLFLFRITLGVNTVTLIDLKNQNASFSGPRNFFKLQTSIFTRNRFARKCFSIYLHRLDPEFLMCKAPGLNLLQELGHQSRDIVPEGN